mgnify:CR=1 FL=1
MKYLRFVLVMLTFCTNISAQENQSGNLYDQALRLDIESLPKSKNDTLIVQKDDFLSENLPEIINNYNIKYLQKKEIEKYDGTNVSLRKVFPINIQQNLLIVEIAYFGYATKSKLWVRSGGSYYKFKYDCNKSQFIFFEKVEYGI